MVKKVATVSPSSVNPNCIAVFIDGAHWDTVRGERALRRCLKEAVVTHVVDQEGAGDAEERTYEEWKKL